MFVPLSVAGLKGSPITLKTHGATLCNKPAVDARSPWKDAGFLATSAVLVLGACVRFDVSFWRLIDLTDVNSVAARMVV